MSKDNASEYNHRDHIGSVIKDIFSSNNEKLKNEFADVMTCLLMQSYVMGAPVFLDQAEEKNTKISYEQKFYFYTMKFAIALTTYPYDEDKQDRYAEAIMEFKENDKIIDSSFKTVTEALALYHILSKKEDTEKEKQKMRNVIEEVSELLKEIN